MDGSRHRKSRQLLTIKRDHLTSLNEILDSPRLPSLPSIAARLLEVTKSADSTVDDVVDVVKSDPALAAKIVRTANSPNYGLSRNVTSIAQAASLLGRSKVTTLVLTFSLSDESRTGSITKEYDRYWLHSLVSATAAEHLEEKLRKPNFDGFLVGLLSDIGQLAILKANPMNYSSILMLANEESLAILDIEDEYLGFNHIDVGVKLIEKWKLPEELTIGLKYHHATLSELKALPDRERDIAGISAFATKVADHFLADKTSANGSEGAAANEIQQWAAELWNISREEFETTLETINEKTKEAGQTFAISTEQLLCPCELMAEAMEQLVEVSATDQQPH